MGWENVIILSICGGISIYCNLYIRIYMYKDIVKDKRIYVYPYGGGIWIWISA